MDFNPLKEVASQKLIEAGTYQGILKEVSPGQRKKYQSEEIEDILKFRFEIPDEKVTVTKSVRPFLSDKANLVLLLKSMEGKNFSESIRNDKNKTWTFIKSLVGKEYLINVVPNEKYNNIQSVSPLPKARKSVPVEPPVIEDDTDDDDIPF